MAIPGWVYQQPSPASVRFITKLPASFGPLLRFCCLAVQGVIYGTSFHQNCDLIYCKWISLVWPGQFVKGHLRVWKTKNNDRFDHVLIFLQPQKTSCIEVDAGVLVLWLEDEWTNETPATWQLFYFWRLGIFGISGIFGPWRTFYGINRGSCEIDGFLGARKQWRSGLFLIHRSLLFVAKKWWSAHWSTIFDRCFYPGRINDPTSWWWLHLSSQLTNLDFRRRGAMIWRPPRCGVGWSHWTAAYAWCRRP